MAWDKKASARAPMDPLTPEVSQDQDLRRFVIESNRIEGISGAARADAEAHAALLTLDQLTVSAVEAFVAKVAQRPLRDAPGMDVRVGNHIAPRGGPEIRTRLESLLDQVNDGLLTAWEAHRAYETLHPFMDGNGRSGRAVWLWQMMRDGRDPWALRRGFLHTFYYQTLGECRLPAESRPSDLAAKPTTAAPAPDEPDNPTLRERGE